MISIIIPAHNESAVIARTLKAVTDGAEPGEFEVLVVCNGCTDETASIARSFGSSVRVIETGVSSKTHALNLGDEASQGYPRIYLDADILLEIDAVRRLAARLESGQVLAVAPTKPAAKSIGMTTKLTGANRVAHSGDAAISR